MGLFYSGSQVNYYCNNYYGCNYLYHCIEPVVYYHSKYGKGDIPILYSNFYCQGWEKALSDCSRSNYLSFSCSTVAGLLCPDGMPGQENGQGYCWYNCTNDFYVDCTDGEMRLIGGESSNEGTIELCHNSLWGLISDAGWDEADAKVVCRQLNLPFNGKVNITKIMCELLLFYLNNLALCTLCKLHVSVLVCWFYIVIKTN